MLRDDEYIDVGWSAAEVDASELVEDRWLIANTTPGKPPSQIRHLARYMLTGGGFTRDQMRRIAQRTGLPYVEAWSAANKGTMRGVRGVLAHHTGTAWTTPGDYPTLRVVRDGRPGLVNALSQFGFGRSATIYLITEKVAWHAGTGELGGITDGNGYLIGVEAESDGGGGHWTPEQVDGYPRLIASILLEAKEDRSHSGRHADWALPRGRKTDFAGWPGGATAFWQRVDYLLANPHRINRTVDLMEDIVSSIDRIFDFRPHHHRPTDDGMGHIMSIRQDTEHALRRRLNYKFHPVPQDEDDLVGHLLSVRKQLDRIEKGQTDTLTALAALHVKIDALGDTGGGSGTV